jgi:hypothetical protein
MRRALPLVFLLVVAGCKRTEKEPAPTASSAPAVVASAASADTGEKEAERIVRAWSDALDKHDVAALENVYADSVVFYNLGTKPKKSVLAMKKSALGPKSTFHQQIIDRIDVKKSGERYEATFTKRSGNGTKLGDTQALIVLSGTPLRITEERDAPRPKTSCEDVASDVAWNTEPVKKAMDAVRKELPKYPDRNEGGIGPEKFEDGTIQASIGVHQPERFETIASYTVYPNGRLDLNVGPDLYTTDPSGQTMDGAPAKKLPDADRKKVTAACGPPAESHGH